MGTTTEVDLSVKLSPVLQDASLHDLPLVVGLRNQKVKMCPNLERNCHIDAIWQRKDGEITGVLIWHGTRLPVIFDANLQVWELVLPKGDRNGNSK